MPPLSSLVILPTYPAHFSRLLISFLMRLSHQPPHSTPPFFSLPQFFSPSYFHKLPLVVFLSFVSLFNLISLHAPSESLTELKEFLSGLPCASVSPIEVGSELLGDTIISSIEAEIDKVKVSTPPLLND